LILLFIFGGKHYNGWDWIVYEAYYRCITPVWGADSGSYCDQYGSFAPLFTLLARLAKGFSENVQMLYIVCSSFTVGMIVFAARSYAANATLALFVFFCLFGWTLGMQAIRQGIAAALFLCSVHYIVNRKLLGYSACIAIAALLHISALLLWFIYFLPRISMSRRTLIAGSCALSVLVYIGKVLFSEQHLEAVYLSGDQLLAYESNKILRYLQDDRLSGTISLGALLKWLAQLPIAWYLTRQYSTGTEPMRSAFDSLFVKLYLLYLAMYLPLGQVSFLSRFLLYFGLASMMVFPMLMRELGQRLLAKVGLVIFCLLVLIAPLRDTFQRIDFFPFNNYFIDEVILSKGLTYEVELDRLLSTPCFVQPADCEKN